MLSHIKDASVRFISQIGLPSTFDICLAVVIASMFTGLVAYQLEQSGQFRAKRAELLHSFARTAEGLQMRTSPLTASTLEAGAISEESREGLRESIRQQYLTSRDLEAYFDLEMKIGRAHV